ncbi:MAG: hypothetical protein KGJ13_08860, partial [Patescibacteria group bacterium]|nr:hypothetical protein [Patescibacteria group bacterium]
MKLTEIFDRANIGEDEKARRVLNVSNAQANITADEIENGVPIERLSEIGVPVFRYATQLTIHGRLPDFDANARPSGYRAIFRNGNGSLGVRYCAIDMAKKRMVLECSKLFKAGWTAHIDSQGLSLSFFSLEKQPVVNAFTTFPRHLIYGFICAGACAMGGYMAIAEIGAIPAENLWPLCQVLFECPDRATFETRRAQKEA